MSNTVDSKLGVWRLALRGLLHFRGMLWPVALGVASATAVIVGALLVGDSVRGSLRYLALDRLGRIEYLLLAPRFFDAATLENWGNEVNGHSQSDASPIPAIIFPQSNIERARSADPTASVAHSGDALLVGVTDEFWSLGDSMPMIALRKNEIVLNQALADELSVVVGDKVTLRLPSQSAVPADSPLGKRDTETVNLPGLTIVRILENRSLGRFDIRSNQRPSKNAFVALETIQSALSREGQINAAILPQVDLRNSELRLAKKGSTNVARVLLPVRTIEGATGMSARSTGDETGHLAATKMLDNLPLSLKDLGFNVQRITRTFPDPKLGEKSSDAANIESTVFDYYQITSDQMMIPDNVVDAARKLWPGESSTPILTYLANEIRKESASQGEVSVTYSTISAIDPAIFPTRSIGFAASPLEGISPLEHDLVYINSWLAERLKVTVGDSLRIDYYLPETIDGREVEQNFNAKIAAIVPLTEPQLEYSRRRAARFSKPPTAFNDPALTPEVPGITDQASINDWDLPFPLTRKVPDEDDAYWNNYRLTPKIFLPLARGQSLFGSRFGSVSSIRISSDIVSSTDEIDRQLTAALRPLASDLGWQVLPLLHQQLAAARGTTPFDVLFLALSFFVILAALILVSLLFRLGIERRASHWGLLLSLGWPLRRVRYLLAIEGLCLACIGSMIGCGLGILYASGVLYLLHSWWVGAVGAPFLTFFVTPRSLIIGWFAGIAMAMLTIWIATRFLAKQPKVRLLRGRTETPIVRHQANRNRWSMILVLGIFVATIGITILGLFLNGQAAGGAFVGAGMLALVGMLVEISRRLGDYRSIPASSRSQSTTLPSGTATSGGPSIATVDGQESLPYKTTGVGASSLSLLASSSIRRNSLRSVLAIGLVSVATLLILSMSLFEAVPDAQGTGGFQLMAESSVPIGKSLSDYAYVKEILGDDAWNIMDATIIPMRVREGDDAGCNNLYQASQPRVLGMSSRIVAYDRKRTPQRTFAWAGSASTANEDERESRWRLLERDGDGSKENPFPVIIDQNTALWALHLTGGIGQKFAYTFGSTEYHFVTVGLLQNTILQGSLILGEKNFGRAFSSVSGYRAWLVHVPNTNSIPKTTNILERGWADEGMDVVESDSVLQNLLAVQNTYLKAFQSLGTLGLLLGTFGLAVVQLRSVMERQSEFGLLRAIGFTRSRIGHLVLLESLVLLVAGLGVGCIAAAVALVPTVFHGTIHPSFLSPTVMLGIVSVFGIVASLLAVRRAMSLKLLEALRGD